MTIPSSTVPAVKAALVAAITAAVGDPAVLVCYGPPGTYAPDDIIFVGDVKRTVVAHAFVGTGAAGAFAEDYDVDVNLRSYRGGGSEQAAVADARAWALVAFVDSAVRADLSLGGLVVKAEPATADSVLGYDGDHKGWICEVTCTVHCLAIL